MTAQTTQQSPIRSKEIRRFLEKIVVNAGVGRLSQQPNFEDKLLSSVRRDIGLLAGQVPQVRRAKKSIAGFKIREGQIVGLRVTLRKGKMVDFFERLIIMVLPRVRDFRGIETKAVDEGGALTLGFKEHLAFPEINPEETSLIFSLQVSVVPRRKDRGAALAAYKTFGVPFKRGKY